jgi:glycerophosphoryl diester phosphodiesterase
MKLISHHGICFRYQPNSLKALSQAIDRGFKFIEIDIRLTKDNEPVCSHDPGLDGRKSEVRSHSYKHFKSVGGLPHFREALDLLNGKIDTLWLDIKSISPGVTDVVTNTLIASDFMGHVGVLAFNSSILRSFKRTGLTVYKLAYATPTESKLSEYSGAVAHSAHYKGESYESKELYLWGLKDIHDLRHQICRSLLVPNPKGHEGISGAIIDFVPWGVTW